MSHLIQSVTRIRILCYSTANIVGMLVPLLAYQLTGSLAAAGYILIVETIAKILSYLYGSSWLKLISLKKGHVSGESFRLISIVLLTIIAMNWLPWQFLALSTIANHVATASSNLLYETNIEDWSRNAPNAHAYQIRADLIAGFLTTALAFFVKNPVVLAMIVIPVQALGVWHIYQKQHVLYPNAHIKHPIRKWIKSEWKAPFTHLTELNRPLLACACLSIAALFPIATLFSQLPFFLDYAFHTKITTQHMAIFNGVKLIIAILIMKHYLKVVHYKKGFDAKMAIFSIITISLALILMLFTTSYLFALALLTYCTLMYFVTPFARKLRQHYSKQSPGITGIMSAAETATFLLAGLLFSSGMTIPHLLLTTTTITIGLFGICAWLFLPEKQTLTYIVTGELNSIPSKV